MIPWSFPAGGCTPTDKARYLAEIPAQVFLDAYRLLWRRHGRAPRRTAAQLRKAASAAPPRPSLYSTPIAIPVEDYAAREGVHPMTIRRKVARGELEGVKIGGVLQIPTGEERPERWYVIPPSLCPPDVDA